MFILNFFLTPVVSPVSCPKPNLAGMITNAVKKMPKLTSKAKDKKML